MGPQRPRSTSASAGRFGRRQARPKPKLGFETILPRFQVVQECDNPVDILILVVDLMERPGETHLIARVIALVALLASRNARHRGVEGKPKQFDAVARVGVGGLQIGLHIGTKRAGQLSKRGNRDQSPAPSA